MLVYVVTGALAAPPSAAPVVAEVSRQVDGALDAIGATSGQRAELRRIAGDAMEDLADSAPDAARIARAALDGFTARTVEQARMEGVRQDAVELLDKASEDLLPHATEAANVLTPAQRRAIAAKVEAELKDWVPNS